MFVYKGFSLIGRSCKGCLADIALSNATMFNFYSVNGIFNPEDFAIHYAIMAEILNSTMV